MPLGKAPGKSALVSSSVTLPSLIRKKPLSAISLAGLVAPPLRPELPSVK